VHNLTHEHGKLGPRAIKMVIIPYSKKNSKGYVMYGEHPYSDMMKANFGNVDFLEDEFSSLGEVKKGLAVV